MKLLTDLPDTAGEPPGRSESYLDRNVSLFVQRFTAGSPLSPEVDSCKRAIEQIRLHAAIMGTLAEGILVVRAVDGTIIFANQQFAAMFGYQPGELNGQPIAIVNAPCDRTPDETAQEITSCLKRDGVWRGEIYNIKKDGSPFWCHVNIATFEHWQHGTVWVGAHTDITERKRMEEAKDALVEQFRQSLSEIKTLRGLIPLCAWCKSVRTDTGYWQNLECYLHDHTDASFSHGICPACGDKMRKTA